MEIPTADIEGCRQAHDRLESVTADLTDDVARQPSSLAGWTVGHVLTHLARNAEAMCRRIEAATRDEQVEQYAGGAAGRASEIEAGAGRAAEQLVDDVVSWSRRLDERFISLPDHCWARPVLTVEGGSHPVGLLPFRRWREVDVHLVDLGVGITPADWPEELVERSLPRLLASLQDRTDRQALMAWLLGRGPAPELTPWG